MTEVGQVIDSSAWTGRGPAYTGHSLPRWCAEEREIVRFMIRSDALRTHLQSRQP